MATISDVRYVNENRCYICQENNVDFMLECSHFVHRICIREYIAHRNRDGVIPKCGLCEREMSRNLLQFLMFETVTFVVTLESYPITGGVIELVQNGVILATISIRGIVQIEESLEVDEEPPRNHRRGRPRAG